MDNMFDKLLHLPLFQGISHERLEETIEKIPFHFLKFKKGERIIDAGDPCTHVRFVVSGRILMEYESINLKFKITHELTSPEVIAPDYLFGLDTCYPFSTYALEECGILQLAKQDYVTMLQSDKIFLYNILNYLSRNSQSRKSQLLNMTNASVVDRIAMLVSAFTTQQSSNITLSFRQRDLCRLLGTRRPALVSAFTYLEDKKLIIVPNSYTAVVNDRKALIDELQNGNTF